MPTTVSKQPDVGAQALQGTVKAVEGQVQGARLAEDNRRFGLQYQEGQRQYDAELGLRYKQLEQMAKEGMLTREQQDKLEMLRQRHEARQQEVGIQAQETLQARGIDAETKARKETHDFQREQQNAQLRQSDVENRRVVAERYKATQRQYELGQQQIAVDRARFNAMDELRATEGVLTQFGRSWLTMSPQQKNLATESLAKSVVGIERWTGQHENPATDEEKAQALQDARTRLGSYDERVRQLTDREMSDYFSRSYAETSGSVAGGQLPGDYLDPQRMFSGKGGPEEQALGWESVNYDYLNEIGRPDLHDSFLSLDTMLLLDIQNDARASYQTRRPVNDVEQDIKEWTQRIDEQIDSMSGALPYKDRKLLKDRYVKRLETVYRRAYGQDPNNYMAGLFDETGTQADGTGTQPDGSITTPSGQ